VEIEAMLDAGYTRPFSAAVTAASATIGPIVPPSIPLVIFGALANESIGRLLVAGFLPGVLMAIFLMLVSSVLA
jgi:TRAP-type C4-dicarboxylate transport system permease large subunit